MEKYAEGKFKTVAPSPLVVSFASDIDNARVYAQAVLQNQQTNLPRLRISQAEYGEFNITQMLDCTTNNGTRGILIDNTHKLTGQSYRTFVVGQWSALEKGIAITLKEFHQNYQSQHQAQKKKEILESMQKATDEFREQITPLIEQCEEQVDNLERLYPIVFGVALPEHDQAARMRRIFRFTKVLGIRLNELSENLSQSVSEEKKKVEPMVKILDGFYEQLSALQEKYCIEFKPLLEQYDLLDDTLFGFVLSERYKDKREIIHEEIQLSEIMRIRRLISAGLWKLQPPFEEL